MSGIIPNKKIITNDFVTPSISGGIGNLMFMIANVYSYALDNNKQLIIPREQSGLILKYKDTLFRKLDCYSNWPEDFVTSDSKVFAGYFQSDSYFKKYSKAIKSLFSPTYEFIKNINSKYPFINDSKITAVHVRRGDYLYNPTYHPSVSKEYVYESIKLINDTDYYFIFSDDIKWCIDNIHLKNSIFISDNTDYEDIWLMSLCDNFVIANSTFSWWGAYLSINENKKVIAPDTWFGPTGPDNWGGIYCEDWIKLPTYYENEKILPIL